MRRSLAVALSVLALAAAAEPPELELSAHVIVTDAPDEFGGLSALIVAEGGRRAQVLSDRGKLFDVALWRDDAERMTRVAVLRAKYLYIYEPQHKVDAEGLARAPDGGVYVSSEKPEAIFHYPARRHWPERTLPVPDMDMPSNRGLEALAIDPEGRLVTIPETPPEGEEDFPVYRLEGETWQRIATFERADGFFVVGADFGPDGLLYVLERAVSALGFQSRVRRIAVTDAGAQPETIHQSRLGRFDNLEGISAWRDAEGALRLTLVSDDNYLAVQRTEFVEFILRE